MKNRPTLTTFSEVTILLFLALRGIMWLTNHDVSHHILDNISVSLVVLLCALLVAANPPTKIQSAYQKSVGAVLICLGIVSLVVALAGIAAILAAATNQL